MMLAFPISKPLDVPDAAVSAESVALVLVCAWCGRPIGRAALSKRRIVSHGMCRPCLEDLLADETHALMALK